jgi:cation transport ATPase
VPVGSSSWKPVPFGSPLGAAGVARIVMLTGDHAAAEQTIGAALDVDCVLANRVPSDKVDAVRAEQRVAPTTMVGDGINGRDLTT